MLIGCLRFMLSHPIPWGFVRRTTAGPSTPSASLRSLRMTTQGVGVHGRRMTTQGSWGPRSLRMTTQGSWGPRSLADGARYALFPDVAGTEGLGCQLGWLKLAHGIFQKLGGLIYRLVGELEGSPVDAE